MSTKHPILLALSFAVALFAIAPAQADPQVRYIIIDNSYDAPSSMHWRGKHLDQDRYRAFGRDYREPTLYGQRHYARPRHDVYREHRNNAYTRGERRLDRDPYSRGRSSLHRPDQHRSDRDRSGERHELRSSSEPRNRYSSGGRIVIEY